MRFIVCGCSLTAANFIYQLSTYANWAIAADRSYFQIVALIAIYLSLRSATGASSHLSHPRLDRVTCEPRGSEQL